MKRLTLFILKLIIALLFLIGKTTGQTSLKRRGQLGIQLQWVNNPVLDSNYGFIVKHVFKDKTFYNAGIKEEDHILSLNNQALQSPQVLRSLNLRAGNEISIRLNRSGTIMTLNALVVAKDYESDPDFETIYTEIPLDQGKASAILTHPKGEGPFPVIYFIQGYSCFSIDALHPMHPYSLITKEWTKKGYAVFRMEKPGMGDSEGCKPCQEISFKEEIEAFNRGLKTLSERKDIKKDQIFVFGHSLGGYVAPHLDAAPIKGIMAYGTSHEPWSEYLLQMVRFQNPRMGESFTDVEDDIPFYATMFQALNKEFLSPSELVQKDTIYKRLMRTALMWNGGDYFMGRHYTFNADIENYTTTKAWANTKSNVFIMYGEGDFQAIDQRASKNIIDIVNRNNPGHGYYRFLPQTDHSMIQLGTMDESFAKGMSRAYGKLMQENFNHDFIKITDQWIQMIINSNPSIPQPDLHMINDHLSILRPNHPRTGNSSGILYRDYKANILIDPGMSDQYPQLKSKLKEMGIDRLDYLSLSHGHLDHSASLPLFLDENSTWLVPNSQKGLISKLIPTGASYERIMHYSDSLVIPLSSDTLKIYAQPQGSGHTSGDQIYYWTESNVFYLGDLLFYKQLPQMDSYKAEQLDLLIAQLKYWCTRGDENSQFIPGHSSFAPEPFKVLTKSELEIFIQNLETCISWIQEQKKIKTDQLPASFDYFDAPIQYVSKEKWIKFVFEGK